MINHKQMAKEHRKIRYILMCMWGLVFCLILIGCLNVENPHPIQWILIGIPIGVIFIMLLDEPLFKLENDFIDCLLEHNAKLHKMIDGDLSEMEKKARKLKIKRDERI